ncbi:thiamine ABC transporter ATP-binding protein ThiQ [Enterobacteriaceae bacterium ESL0689]|nr:thiamine ABC transporter ATP-binding protein ThiQ [Enterobacteriaceae bacterium ESL0689]
MLKLNQLTGQYPDLTLCFSLTVQPGERIAILGSSGSGKSTLLNMIAGFLPASHGTLLLNGQDHTTTPPSRRPVSMLFQENNLFSHLTIGQNIALGLHPGLKITATQREHLYALAKKMAIYELLDRLPGELSGGQRQRAALARCLVRNQPVLLLDEPFSALDPALRQEMLALVADICQQQHLTLLMVTHNEEDAAFIAPRSLIVANHQITQDGATRTLLRGHYHAVHLAEINGSIPGAESRHTPASTDDSALR